MSTLARGTPLSDADEKILADALARRDPAAFERMVALYQPRVARLAQRLLGWDGDVDDLVQDVFLVALSKGGWRGESSAWTWLTAVTLNRCRSRLRRRALFARFRRRQQLRPLNASPPADRATQLAETNEQVRRAVAALPAKYREAIVLFYLEDLSAAEIAQLLGIGTDAVNARLYRGRRMLKEALARFSEGFEP